MTTAAETLTDLVSARVGEGRDLTYRAFEDRALDPATGYRPSRDTVWKIAKGKPVKVSPELVRAVAAGLSLPLSRVQAAAAYQFTGFVASQVGGATVVHDPGVSPADMPLTRATVERWGEEEDGS